MKMSMEVEGIIKSWLQNENHKCNKKFNFFSFICRQKRDNETHKNLLNQKYI